MCKRKIFRIGIINDRLKTCVCSRPQMPCWGAMCRQLQRSASTHSSVYSPPSSAQCSDVEVKIPIVGCHILQHPRHVLVLFSEPLNGWPFCKLHAFGEAAGHLAGLTQQGLTLAHGIANRNDVQSATIQHLRESADLPFKSSALP